MTGARRFPVRYRVLTLLFVISFVNYLLRNSISVAVPSMRAEFGFTSAELGWILGSFNLTYTFLMIPGGILGERSGARRALAILAVTWGVLTWLTGFVPALMAASATGVLVALVGTRLLVGATHAPIFPVIAGAIESWFPPGRWALANAVSTSGPAIGQAAIGPIVTALILHFGWRESFYALAPLGVLAGIWWYTSMRDRPGLHPAVGSEEAALIAAGRDRAAPAVDMGGWRSVILKRDVILLAVAYFCMNIVFYFFSQWLFAYLAEERGFSMLEGGWLYVLPFVTGSVFTLVGGWACDLLCRRFGPRAGCRATAMPALVLAAVFLLIGAHAPNPYVAVAMLSLCFGFTLFTDAAHWAAVTYSAGPHTMSATGVLNFGGNVAGLMAPVVGYLIDHAGWIPTLASGSVIAVIGAGTWMFVRLDDCREAHR
jgi:ACS family glucarate transporter-like MFS transporter